MVRSLSGAFSPVSTRSQQSVNAEEDQEYCKSRQSWTGMTEVDLVANLSAQERTRQEVLFEIVSSEERYVLDLIKMKETFIDKLIPQPRDVRLSLLPDPLSQTWSRHSESTSSSTSPNPGLSNFGSRSVSRFDKREDDLDHLPIAAHFVTSRSATPVGGLLPPLIVQQKISESSHPSSPPRSIVQEEEDLDATIRIKRTYHHLSRGHPAADGADGSIKDKSLPQKPLPSLPLPPLPSRSLQDPASRERISNRPLSAQSLKPAISSESTSPTDRWSRRFSATRKRSSIGGLSDEVTDLSSITLPEDLRIVLEVTRNSILKGHIALSDALRERYDDQYPLSHLFQEYSKFVIHLERAIQQLDDCHDAFVSNKKKLYESNADSPAAAGSAIQALNQIADDKGETGLAISLSKPFQRLLKYPLLFQNLLYNTDATLSEYDSCTSLLSEVDGIVRSLEDEKANEDKRERTRDTLARIEGLERHPTLSLPRSKRISIGETPAADVATSSVIRDNTNRRSFRRLSDLMRGIDYTDLWEVVFSDVTLLCEKVGTTSLPIYSRTGRGNDEGRMHGKSKTTRTGRRNRQIEPRNLYKFVSVREWHLEKQNEPDGRAENTNTERRPSTSSESAMSHPESIKEESSEESDSDDSEQMDFILGAAAPRRRASVRPEATSTTDTKDVPLQAIRLPDSSKKTVPAPRTARVSSRATAKGTLPSRARSPTEMINSQAKFGTRLRHPELSISGNGRSSAMARPIDSSAIVRGEVVPSRSSQRAVSTPVHSVAWGSTRPPPSSVRGTRRVI
ncbi:hypothetical protein QFC21_000479 [Naganishia friedmannii]|uniref:Uncharacterized protein n=1 Tax=Naganishia friedmannii TaxID=89922 RepID=A0ACC2WE68_9TREE|nr:hypothetical protein QFC21_000479 [Naganishia friedmannii]